MSDLLLNIKLKTSREGSGLKDYRDDLRSIRIEGRKLGDSAKDFVPPSLTNPGGRQSRRRLVGDLRDSAQAASEFGRSVEDLLEDPIRSATQYETSLANISTLTENAEFAQGNLRDITREASLEFGGSAAEQAGSLYDIISAGAGDAATATKTLTAANRLSIGGLTSVGTATKAISATTANFKAQQVDAADASDVLFTIVRKGRTTLGETAAAFPKVASAAGGMKLKIEEAAAIFSTLTLTTKSSAVASTQASALLSATQKPTQGAIKALKALNRQRKKNNKEALRIDSEALKDIGAVKFAQQFKDLDDATLAKIFGAKNARAGLIGLISNIESLKEGITAQQTRLGAANDAFIKISQTRAQRLKVVDAQIEDAKLAVGEAILPLTEQLVPALAGTASFVGELARNSPVLTTMAGSAALLFVGLGKVGRVMIGVDRGIKGLTAASSLLSKGINSPLGAVTAIAGLGTLIAAEFAPQLIGATESLSDKLGRELARIQGFSQENKTGRQSAAQLAAELRTGGRKVLRGADGKEITDRATRVQLAAAEEQKLRRGGVGENTISQTLLNKGFRADEFGVAANQRALNQGSIQSKVDVSIRLDQDGRATVAGVEKSNHEGGVEIRNGEAPI